MKRKTVILLESLELEGWSLHGHTDGFLPRSCPPRLFVPLARAAERKPRDAKSSRGGQASILLGGKPKTFTAAPTKIRCLPIDGFLAGAVTQRLISREEKKDSSGKPSVWKRERNHRPFIQKGKDKWSMVGAFSL